jgi:alkanesulfonate monooxygenase SsuD/methylene tetrahydromethanopterin reductase-like flavin-dependent oxidoreductase (luciferase family)
MKSGLFCTFENHHQNAHCAIQDQVALVQHAEQLGFEEAWITEHHFSEHQVSPSILPLMAYLAGVTSTIDLGSAAVLLAFHDPIQVAEDVAMLDHLCQGRFRFGIAKGGPFPEQNRHFGISMTEARARTLEALALIEKLLYHTDVSFTGQFYHCDRLTIHPRPFQSHIPVYIASSDPDAIALAALHSFGIMGGPPFSLNQLQCNLAHYRAINNSGADALVLTRFFLVAPTDEAAIAAALPFIQTFSARMQANTAQLQNVGNTQHLTLNGKAGGCFDPTYLLGNSIIGSVATCRDRIKRFQDELNLGTLALKPCALDLQQNLDSLTLYAEAVRPSL